MKVAEKIARLCYAQFEKGMDKHDVSKFRAECLEKINASPEAAALQEELAERLQSGSYARPFRAAPFFLTGLAAPLRWTKLILNSS